MSYVATAIHTLGDKVTLPQKNNFTCWPADNSRGGSVSSGGYNPGTSGGLYSNSPNQWSGGKQLYNNLRAVGITFNIDENVLPRELQVFKLTLMYSHFKRKRTSRSNDCLLQVYLNSHTVTAWKQTIFIILFCQSCELVNKPNDFKLLKAERGSLMAKSFFFPDAGCNFNYLNYRELLLKVMKF